MPRSRILCLVLALALLATGGVPASRAEYKAPDFTRALFDMHGVILGETVRTETVDALAALAANFRDDAEVGEGVREMALAIGLRMDPASRAARGVHERLSANTLPGEIAGFASRSLVANRLWSAAALLDDADASDDERALRCYLLDIARRIDPDNAAGHTDFQKAAARGPFPGWQGILGRETEETFVFPQEGSRLGETQAPDDPGTDPPPAAEQAQLAGSSAAIGFPVPAEETGGGDARCATLTLSVNRPVPEPGQPVRILFPSAVEGEPHRLATSGDNLVVALRTLHADWPADGSKVMARFDTPYTARDGRAGELPVALALHALHTGKPVPAGLAAIGGVEVDGTISPVEDLLPRLHALQAPACQVLVVPAASETALLDLLVAGDIGPLLRHQLFSVVHLKDAVALVDEPPPAALQKARLDFDEVRDVAIKASAPAEVVRTEAVRERLRGILKLAPGHASAQFLLRYALGEVPEKLSPAGSRHGIASLAAAYRALMDGNGDLLVTGDAEQLRARTVAGLTALRNKLDASAIPLADALGDFSRAFEDYGKVKFKGSQQGRALKDEVRRRWMTMMADLEGSVAPSPEPDPAPESDEDAPAIDFGL